MKKTIQERIAVIDQILGMRQLMTKPLKAGTLKNKDIAGRCTGYTFQLDNLSYRGIWVSTLEDIELLVDGQPVAKSDILFRIHGLTIPLENLGGHSEVFWGARDEAIISVNKIGGLPPGDHKFEIIIKKRADFGHSYGEGTQGYETATEFHHPAVIRDEITYTIC